MDLERLDETARYDQCRRREGNYDSYSHFDRSHSCRPILDPLVVWNIASRTGDGNFTSPDFAGSGEDGTVRKRLLIPVGGHKVHVFAGNDAAIMDGERGTGASKGLFYSDVSGVREGFVDGDTGRELYDLLVGSRRMEMIALIKLP